MQFLLQSRSRANILQQEAGARFLINPVLETVRRIVRDPASHRDVMIIPEMTVASGDGVPVQNTKSGFKINLTGVVDYGIVRYRTDIPDHKGRCLKLTGTEIH